VSKFTLARLVAALLDTMHAQYDRIVLQDFISERWVEASTEHDVHAWTEAFLDAYPEMAAWPQ
jgi:hypothetical protein